MEEHKITWSLIIANVAVFLLVFSFPESLREWIFLTFSFSQGTAFEVWRWFTSIFLHASASHLFFNMLGLFFFGKILEKELSENKEWFMAIYFVSAFLGNFVYMFTESAPVVGASGAVFGIMGAVMLLNPVKRIHMYLFPLPLGVVAITFAIFETMVVYFQPDMAMGNVAHIAHVAGLITGATFAYFYKPKRAAKGTFVLFICLLLLIFLAPLFTLVSSIGSFFLEVMDAIFGFVLYGLAGLIGLLWV
jgi:membrane associated rhomboid family serine protease